MSEWERHKHAAQVDRQWQALIDRLKQEFGSSFEHASFYARRVLDQAGPDLLAQLAALPLDTQVQIAKGFARSGEGTGLPVAEALFAAEQIANPASRYRKPRDNDPEERQLHQDAMNLVGEFYGSMPDGNQPADPTEPPPPAGAEPTPEAKAEAARLMHTKGPYFNKGDPNHELTRARVQGLLEGTIAPQAPQAPAQASPQTPGEGNTGGQDHA
jgi:hypothetical protein